MKQPVICITGGHLTPAVAVIDEIRSSHPGWKIIFIGRKQAAEGDTHQSEEYRIIKDKNIVFYTLKTGRLLRSWSIKNLFSSMKIPGAICRSYTILAKEKPDAVLSFGGYLALPVALAAGIRRIPVVTHEQTCLPGLANRLIARISTRILVSHSETAAFFPHRQVRFTGLPLRKQVFDPPKTSNLMIPEKLPLIYITGGATGARSMNRLIYPIISDLVLSHAVVHQTGRVWINEALKVRQDLPADKRSRYVVAGYLDQQDHYHVLNRAAVLVGRSGANTVAEATALGKPAVFIPLPWSAGQEQRLNPGKLKQSGQAVIFDQASVSAPKIRDAILSMAKRGKFSPDKKDLVVWRNAAKAVITELASVI